MLKMFHTSFTPPTGSTQDAVEERAAERLALLTSALCAVGELAVRDAAVGEIALVASDWVAALAPRCSVFVVEASDDGANARVVSDVNAPRAWRNSEFALADAPLVASALREPGRAHRANGPAALRSLPDSTLPPVRCESLLCVGVPAREGLDIVLAACGTGEDVEYLGTLLPMMARFVASLRDHQARVSIERAKDEWECTADALPHIVCLLDRQGRVLRANRAVERWGLGRVHDARGRTMHGLLHPGCRSRACNLDLAVDQAWDRLDGAEEATVEVRDGQLARSLSIVIRPMQDTTSGRKSSGDSYAAIIVSDVSEMHRVQSELRAMNEELEDRVQSRTRALAGVNLALRTQVERCESAERLLEDSRDELALLSAQLMRAQEDERHRIAQELHDTVGQQLTAVKYSLERAAELARQHQAEDPQLTLERAITGIRQVMDELRSISMNLRPTLLDDLGVVSALQWFCRQFSEGYPQLDLGVQLRLTNEDVPEALAVPIYRTVQEALCNVVKHAAADHVSVLLHRSGDSLVLEVTDDGVGLHPSNGESAGQGRLGLRGMRERAEMTGGRFTIESRPDSGTRVRIEWLLQATDGAGGAP